MNKIYSKILITSLIILTGCKTESSLVTSELTEKEIQRDQITQAIEDKGQINPSFNYYYVEETLEYSKDGSDYYFNSRLYKSKLDFKDFWISSFLLLSDSEGSMTISSNTYFNWQEYKIGTFQGRVRVDLKDYADIEFNKLVFGESPKITDWSLYTLTTDYSLSISDRNDVADLVLNQLNIGAAFAEKFVISVDKSYSLW